MKHKRITSTLTAAVLSAALLAAPASAAAQTARFTDLAGHPAQEIIERYAEQGIINGTGEDLFEPDRTLMRCEMSAILDRYFSYTAMSPNTFPDLQEGKWYYECMLRLNAAGIVVGDTYGIRPEDTLRWDEALVMFCRAFRVTPRFDVSAPWPVAPWAESYVAALYEGGFLPSELPELTSPFTRAEAVIILDSLATGTGSGGAGSGAERSEEHTSELQSPR